MIRLSLRTNASLHDQQPIDDYSPLGYTRRPVIGEWDDPTWIRACVDPDLMDDYEPKPCIVDIDMKAAPWMVDTDDRVTDQP